MYVCMNAVEIVILPEILVSGPQAAFIVHG